MMKGDGDKKAAEPRRVRGTATFHDDMSVEFVPQGKGEPVQRNVKKVGEAAPTPWATWRSSWRS